MFIIRIDANFSSIFLLFCFSRFDSLSTCTSTSLISFCCYFVHSNNYWNLTAKEKWERLLHMLWRHCRQCVTSGVVLCKPFLHFHFLNLLGWLDYVVGIKWFTINTWQYFSLKFALLSVLSDEMCITLK